VTRFLLVAAVLATGCEQIKAPKKLKELEGRVDELTAQVEKMTGKPMASRLKDKDKEKHEDEGHAAPKEGDGKGAGEAKDEAKDEGKDGKEAKEGEAHDHDAEPAAAAAKDEVKESSETRPKDEGERPKDDAKAKDGEADKKDGEADKKDGEADKKDGEADKKDGEAKESSEPKGKDDVAKADAKPDDKRTKDERALDDIAKLVATTTGKKKPAEGDDKVAKAKPKDAKDAKDAKDKDKPKDKPATEWGYNAKIGPPVWGSLDPAWRVCEAGRAQSPVDIEPRAGKAGPIVFHYKTTPGTIVDNGHALQVDFGEGSWIEVSDHTYQLVQLNFHTPSEHTIAGEHYPLEAQLVHKDSGGKLAVIAVLYDVGPESRAVGGLLAKWPRKPGVAARLPGGLDPASLLPETRTAFRYTGSLTTPPCTEGVIWNVMRRQLTDSKAHLDAFTARYKINARETRPLNDRKIE
jgi:carbonic anhydrase